MPQQVQQGATNSGYCAPADPARKAATAATTPYKGCCACCAPAPCTLPAADPVPFGAGKPVSVCEGAEAPELDPAASGEHVADGIERAANPTLCPPVAPCGASASPRAASPAKPKPASRRNGLRYLEAMIAWTPRSEAEGHRSTVGQVMVGPWPDRTGWSDAFACHGGGAEVTEHLPSKARVTTMVLRDFHTLVCRDGMRPRVVHEALLAISEYRRAIDPDIPGARGPGRDRSSNAAARPW